MYDTIPAAVRNSELTDEYLPYSDDAWRRMIAEAEREDEESL